MKKSGFILCLLLMTAFCHLTAQNNYYVSPSGNDDHSGASDQPWETIMHAQEQLVPGDTLNIMAGTYNEKIQLENSGSVDNYITIRNHENDEVIIDGSGLTDQESIIEIYDLEYIIIEGLYIENNEMPDAQGILIENMCNNIIIRDNHISQINFSTSAADPVDEETNSQPLIVYGTDPDHVMTEIHIEGNEIYNNRTGYSECLAINGNVDGFSLMQNYIHDNSNIGIDIIGHEGTCPDPLLDQARNGVVKGNVIGDCVSEYATSGGIYIDGGKNILVENNYSYRNGYGIEIGCENRGKTTSGITVRNNLFFNNEVAGLALGGFDYPDGSGHVASCTVNNNSFFSNDFSSSYTGELYLSYSDDCKLFNNIFYTSDQNILAYADGDAQNLYLDYNLYFCPGGTDMLESDWNGSAYIGFNSFLAGTSQDEHSIFSDPLFVSTSLPDPDLHIQTGSMAIDNGYPAYLAATNETDIDGMDRIYNQLIDIGADEFHLSSGQYKITESQDILVFPNPTMEILHLSVPLHLQTRNLYYRLSTLNGKTVTFGKISSSTLRLPKINTGMYLLEISSDEQKQFTEKIIIF